MGKSISKFRLKLKTFLVRCGYHSRPHFLIIGAQKAGTSALHAYLSAHPSIVPAREKEIHFFTRDLLYHQGAAWYYNQFPLPHNVGRRKYTFETSPSYLFYEKGAKRIHEFDPGIKLIILLRNPIDRGYSQWNMYRLLLERNPEFFRKVTRTIDEEIRNWFDKILSSQKLAPFEQEVRNEIAIMSEGDTRTEPNYVRRGLYYEQIMRFREFFERDQLLILDSGELKANTRTTLELVTQFLGVPNHRWQQGELELKHVREYVRPIPRKTQLILREFFRIPNEDLYNLLGCDLGWN